MKNTLKRKNSRLLIGLLLAITAATCLEGRETYKMTARRADYFIITANKGDTIEIGSRGCIVAQHRQSALGTFVVIDRHGQEYLCEIQSLRPGATPGETDRASFSRPDTGSTTALTLDIGGILFRPLAAHPGYLLSAQPVPVSTIDPVDTSGIKQCLFTVEKETNGAYAAELVSLEDVSRWRLDDTIDFSAKNTILLGTREGNLGMIYEEGGVCKHTAISANALKKFKDTMYFYIILKKLK
jgi:hypothetical protein